MLPSAIAPPIRTMRSTFAPPVRASNCAMFVSGPVGTSVTGTGLAAIVRAMKSTAPSPPAARLGGGRAGPSRPLSPWTWDATISSRTSGRSAPAATAMSARPARSSTRIAFAVVFASVWFPCTVVTPSSATSGLASASRSAIASSCPGSQSMMTGVGIRQVWGARLRRMITRLDFVAVPSRDAERTRGFYIDTLGLRPDEKARFEFWVGETCCGIWEPDKMGGTFAPQKNAHLAFHVDDVAAARAELEAKGVEFTGDTFDTGVCHMAFFTDPDGNDLMLHHRYKPRD